jgi:hypothetical protein
LSDGLEVWEADDPPTELASTAITLNRADNDVAGLVCVIASSNTGACDAALHLLNRDRLVGDAKHALQPRDGLRLLDASVALFNSIQGSIDDQRASVDGGARIDCQAFQTDWRIRKNLTAVPGRIKGLEIASQCGFVVIAI